MATGGKREGAGRKKGSKNKVRPGIKEKILASGEILPLEFLLTLMRADEPKQERDEEMAAFLARWRSWKEDRLDAAKAAAPYIHPKLESIEHKGDPDKPISHSLKVEFVDPA